MKIRPHQRVAVADAQARALACLTRDPTPAAAIADRIWPNHGMTAQGAGAAASRILKLLEARNLAACARGGRTGWVLIEAIPSKDLLS